MYNNVQHVRNMQARLKGEYDCHFFFLFLSLLAAWWSGEMIALPGWVICRVLWLDSTKKIQRPEVQTGKVRRKKSRDWGADHLHARRIAVLVLYVAWAFFLSSQLCEQVTELETEERRKMVGWTGQIDIDRPRNNQYLIFFDTLYFQNRIYANPPQTHTSDLPPKNDSKC